MATAGAPFIVHEPAGPPVGLVLDSPHSGMAWPPDFDPAAPRDAILTTWDAFVDELWLGAVGVGATLLSATFPRAYIDVNRAADDIDPALLNGPWPTPLRVTDYSRRGMGLIRRLALPGVPMYARPLSVAAVRRRIDACYAPYRAALGGWLDRRQAEHGEVWHLNCHSMKSRGNAMNVDSGATRCDIVVSDREGVSADPVHTRWLAERLRAQGFTVQVNDPYTGGDLVAHFGAPDRGRHSFQIEINRATYMDEAACERHAGFDRVQRALTTLAGEISAHLETRMSKREPT